MKRQSAPSTPSITKAAADSGNHERVHVSRMERRRRNSGESFMSEIGKAAAAGGNPNAAGLHQGTEESVHGSCF